MYKNLINKSKKAVIEELGHGFNFFPDNKWTYNLKKNWMGRKTILTILFHDDRVTKIEIKKTYK